MNTVNNIHTSEKSENYNGIDLLKFICSILVFLLHYPLFEGCSFELSDFFDFFLEKYICRIAVPFFFVCSGFFLFKKMDLYDFKKEKITTYCFKLLQMSGVWHFLLIIGGTQHLWYLGATVTAVIILTLCLKFRIKLKYIWLIAVFLYVIGLMGDSYSSIFETYKNIPGARYIILGYEYFFQRTRNGLFFGFIFVLMGANFAHSKVKINHMSAIAGFIGSMICLFTEVFTLNHYYVLKNHNMYIFLIPSVYFLFHLSSNIKLKDNTIYKKLRGIGVLVYFSHLLMYNFVLLGMSFVEKFTGFDSAPYQSIISLIFTLLVATLIEHFSHKEKCKWLKWLY